MLGASVPFSANYTVSYSHFPQVFPQVNIAHFLSEIGISPDLVPMPNIPVILSIVACILYCIFIRYLYFFSNIKNVQEPKAVPARFIL